MTMPISEQLPPDEPQPEENLPRSRRRRARQIFTSGDAGERAEFLADLVHQGTATLDFYLFALLCGIVLGAAIWLDSPALFILAALLAPFMAPVIGMALATATGSLGYFLRSLASLLVGGVLVFVMGALAGMLIPVNTRAPFDQAVYHTQFSWPDLAVLVLGTIVTVTLVVRNPRSRPLVSSVALAYELLLPLGVYRRVLSGHPTAILALALIMLVWGSYVICLINKDPHRLVTEGENHPAWHHMYWMMMVGHLGLAGAYLLSH